jgi:hypothetical protein
MKTGDLVNLQLARGKQCVGLIIEEYPVTCGAAKYTEVRVRWLDYPGIDVSWVMRKDLEVIGENR